MWIKYQVMHSKTDFFHLLFYFWVKNKLWFSWIFNTAAFWNVLHVSLHFQRGFHKTHVANEPPWTTHISNSWHIIRSNNVSQTKGGRGCHEASYRVSRNQYLAPSRRVKNPVESTNQVARKVVISPWTRITYFPPICTPLLFPPFSLYFFIFLGDYPVLLCDRRVRVWCTIYLWTYIHTYNISRIFTFIFVHTKKVSIYCIISNILCNDMWSR